MNEPQQVDSVVPYEERIDFLDLFRIFWAGKWLIAGITLAGTVFAVVVALLLPDLYRAEALLAPTQDDRGGNLSALAGQYGGLANLAGINLASESSDKTAMGLETLKSRKFIANFIEYHNILVPVMASKGWDNNTEELEIDPDIYNVTADEWVRKAKPPRKTIPSLQEAYEEFGEKILAIKQDKKTGFVTVTVEHYSPIVAKQWVDWLVQDINSTIMRQDVNEAEQAINYLEEQINATPLADLQNVFFRLIEEQTKTVMLAKVSPEYMFRTIDPAVAPELKTKPRRAWIAALGMFLGGLIGIVVVLLKDKTARQMG